MFLYAYCMYVAINVRVTSWGYGPFRVDSAFLPRKFLLYIPFVLIVRRCAVSEELPDADRHQVVHFGHCESSTLLLRKCIVSGFGAVDTVHYVICDIWEGVGYSISYVLHLSFISAIASR